MSDNIPSVIYFGDETTFRRKKCGLSLIEQLFLSINSIRENWSSDVKIFFFHSEKLSQSVIRELHNLNVNIERSHRVVEQSFPLSNKILIGELYRAEGDILFLDCDTIIHRPVCIDYHYEMLVAYDALRNLEYLDYREVFSYLKQEIPKGEIYQSPSFEYYHNDASKQFPVFNSGVFFLKKSLQQSFYRTYEQIFLKLYAKFKMHKWSFYIEQISFCLAILKLKIEYSIFPKGYNFICTPRAPFLKDWDEKLIIIEHYAGDNGSPLAFDKLEG